MVSAVMFVHTITHHIFPSPFSFLLPPHTHTHAHARTHTHTHTQVYYYLSSFGCVKNPSQHKEEHENPLLSQEGEASQLKPPKKDHS